MENTDIHLPYEMLIEIEPADIDQLSHVNNAIYLRWVQTVAFEL